MIFHWILKFLNEEGRQMDNGFIEYCIDGHNIIKNEVKDIKNNSII